NINAGHEITSKARIIHQIQLIRGITPFVTTQVKHLIFKLLNKWLSTLLTND
ncbi:DNA helicase, partial [Escherichia coli]